MQEFSFECQIIISAYTTVRANTLEDALKIAKQRYVELNSDPYVCWSANELDGFPVNIEEIKNG